MSPFWPHTSTAGLAVRRYQAPLEGRKTDTSVVSLPSKSAGGSRSVAGPCTVTADAPEPVPGEPFEAVPVPRARAKVWVPGVPRPSTPGIFSTWNVKSTAQRSVEVPAAPSTTVLDGVNVTTPLASGAETENDFPAHAVPDWPVAVGLRANTPGSGTGQTVSELAVLVPHEGARRSCPTVIVSPDSGRVEMFRTWTEPGRPLSPTVTGVGIAGNTARMAPAEAGLTDARTKPIMSAVRTTAFLIRHLRPPAPKDGLVQRYSATTGRKRLAGWRGAGAAGRRPRCPHSTTEGLVVRRYQARFDGR